MYRIIDGRGTGKTERLFMLAKENNYLIVCSNPTIYRRKAEQYGIFGLDFMSYTEYIARRCLIQRHIVVDELENFIQYFTNGYCAGYNFSLEDKK